MALVRAMVQTLFWNDAPVEHLTPASLTSGYNIPLPSDQWLQDMTTMQQMGMANFQVALATHTLDTSTLDLQDITPFLSNATVADKSLCGIQLMQSPGGFV